MKKVKQFNHSTIQPFNHFLQRILLAALFVILAGGFVNVSRAHAAYLNITGFETGDTSEAYAVNISPSIQSSIKRTGSYAAQIALNTSYNYYSIGKLNSDGTKAVLGASSFVTFYFQINSIPAGRQYIAFMKQSDGNGWFIGINADGTLHLDGQGDSVSAGTLTSGTWYRIEFRNSGNVGYLRVNGGAEVSDTGFSSALLNEVMLGYGGTANTALGYYDDVAISNSAYPGAGQVNILKPNGAGTEALGWASGTGSTYTEVNEVPPNGDTTYIKSVTDTDTRNFAMDDAATAGVLGTIGTVKFIGINRNEGGAPSGHVRFGVGSISDSTTTSTAAFPAAYAAIAKLRDVNPNTSAAWSSTAIDGIILGVAQVGTSLAARNTALYAMVWSSPAEPTAPTVTTSAAGSITTDSAILNSTINPNGASTNVSYLWGTVADVACNLQPNTLAGPTALTGTSNLSGATTQASLTGRAGNTTYYFCVMATNSYGTNYGTVTSFTTSPNTAAYTYMPAGSVLGGGATDCQDNANGAPCAPTSTSASAASTSQINLSWGVNSAGGAVPAVTSYDVYKCGLNQSGCSSPTISNVSSATFAFNDTSLTCSTSPSYYYKVVSKGANGDTASSVFSGVTSTCCTNTTLYPDTDGDGYGTSGMITQGLITSGSVYSTIVATSVTINKPLDIVPGTFMLLGVVHDISSAPTVSGGGNTWNLLATRAFHASGGISLFWKYAGASEPASYSVGTLYSANAWITSFGNVATSNPIGTVGTYYQSGLTHRALGITPTSDNYMLITMMGTPSRSGEYTLPSGMTEFYDKPVTNVHSVAAFYKWMTSSSYTGNVEATYLPFDLYPSADPYYASIIFELKRINSASSNQCITSVPPGWSSNNTDCDDNISAYYQNLNGYPDKDGDGERPSSQSSICSGASLRTGVSSSPGTDCNSLDGARWQNVTGYVDWDNDLYTTGSQQQICTSPSLDRYQSSASGSSDCYDTNMRARPWQTEFYTTHRGDGSFDYDCDGSSEKKVENWNVRESSGGTYLRDSYGSGPCGKYASWSGRGYISSYQTNSSYVNNCGESWASNYCIWSTGGYTRYYTDSFCSNEVSACSGTITACQ